MDLRVIMNAKGGRITGSKCPKSEAFDLLNPYCQRGDHTAILFCVSGVDAAPGAEHSYGNSIESGFMTTLPEDL